MNKDELQRIGPIAKEAGFDVNIHNVVFVNTKVTGALHRFASLIAADEREACAKVCEDAPEPDGADLAERIRARGQA